MMRERRISTILLIFTLLFCFVSKAQTRKELIAFGDNAYHHKHYASAAYFYLQVLDPSVKKEKVLTYPYEVSTFERKSKKDSSKKDNSENSQTQYVIHQLAASYRLNADYENAEKWYAKAVESKDTAYPKDLLYYAEVLMNNRKYDEAKTICDSILKKDTLIHSEDIKELAKNATLGCYYAQDPASENKSLAVYLMDSDFNAGTSSYGLRFYGNEKHVSFTSGRDSNVVSDSKKQDPKYRSDIYIADRSGKKFSNFRPAGKPINTENDEGSGYLSIDKTTFYFTKRDAITGQTAIYISKHFNGNWLKPLKINNKVNVAGYDSKDPCLSLDGSLLFYSSNRPGGKGGYDIWMCHIDDFGNLSAPKDLNNSVNTPGDEVAPFFHYNTKTLFYSSNGLVGIGGLDVYKSSFNSTDSSFSTPKNLGKPINSSKDDAYYTLTKDQTIGYVSSDRSPCKACGKDYSGSHYCYKLYKFSKPENHYKIKGIVYDANTNKPIANALVTFKDVTYTVDPFFVITDKNGAYEKDLQPGLLLFLKAQKVDYFADATSISTKGLTTSKTFIHDFYLNPIPKKDINLPGIYYDFDKATLRQSSKKVLDKLVKFLNVNDNIAIQINSYCDQRGNDNYNLRLSKARAKSVVDYLIANGIEKDRLKAKGYGEEDPLVTQAEIDKMATKDEKNKAYQKNRRTTFKVLSQSYKDISK